MVDRRKTLGNRGEAMAAAWYRNRGYDVLDRNWRRREGELDLVLQHGTTVVFCEVKTRSGTAFGMPVEAVTATKQRRLRLLAARWLDEAAFRPGQVRFDVVSVLDGQIDVLQDAF